MIADPQLPAESTSATRTNRERRDRQPPDGAFKQQLVAYWPYARVEVESDTRIARTNRGGVRETAACEGSADATRRRRGRDGS